MAKGDGGITQLKDKNGKPRRDLWEVRISTGKDPITGKYGLITRRVHGTKAQARKVRDEIKQQLKRGIDPNAGKITFDAFAAKWLVLHKEANKLGENTIVYYEHLQARVRPWLGNAPINKITPIMLDEMYCKLLSDGLSNSTVRKVHVYVKQVFSQAVNYDMILRNPADRAKAPKKDPVCRRSLTAGEASTLLQHIIEAEQAAYVAEEAKELRRRKDGAHKRSYMRGLVDISRCVAVRIALATGMRRGEVLSLTWDDFDLRKGKLQVRHSITSAMTVKQPKSRSGIRTISLDVDTVTALQRWCHKQRMALSRIGIDAGGDTPICCDSMGGYLNPNNFSSWWRGFAKREGFEGLRFHELRHTQATLLLAQGVDVKTVQTRLGHADASITLNIYVHAVEENDKVAAETLAKLLGGSGDAGTD